MLKKVHNAGLEGPSGKGVWPGRSQEDSWRFWRTRKINVKVEDG